MLNQTFLQTYQFEIQMGLLYLILVATYYLFAQNSRINKALKAITSERQLIQDEKKSVDSQLLVTQYYSIGAMKLNIMKTLDRLKEEGDSREFEILESSYRALIQEAARYNGKYDNLSEHPVQELIDRVSLDELEHTLFDFYLNYGRQKMTEEEYGAAIQLLKMAHGHMDESSDRVSLNLLLGRSHHALMNRVQGKKTKEELLRRATRFYNEAGEASLFDKAALLIDRDLINEGIYHLRALGTDEAKLKLAQVYLDLANYKEAYDVLQSVNDKASDSFKEYFMDTLIQRREYALAMSLIEYASKKNQLRLRMLFGHTQKVKEIVAADGPMNLHDELAAFDTLVSRWDGTEKGIWDILPVNDGTMWLFKDCVFKKADIIGLSKMLYLHMTGASKISQLDKIFITLIQSLKEYYRSHDELELKYEDLMLDYEGFRMKSVEPQIMMKTLSLVKDTFKLIANIDHNIQNKYKDISVNLKMFLAQFEEPAIQREIHQLLGYFDKANRLISESLKVGDDYKHYLLRGINYQALGEYEYALLDFKSAWERERDPEILYFKAMNYYEAYKQYAHEKLSNTTPWSNSDPIENMMMQTKESGLRKALKTLEDLLEEDKGYMEAAILYGEISIELANSYIRANSDDELKQVYTFFIKELPGHILELVTELFEDAIDYYDRMLIEDMHYFHNSYPRVKVIKEQLIAQMDILKTLCDPADDLKARYLVKL